MHLYNVAELYRLFFANMADVLRNSALNLFYSCCSFDFLRLDVCERIKGMRTIVGPNQATITGRCIQRLLFTVKAVMAPM